jgi:phosphohistidine swiveling domain-containing protein
VRDDPLPLLRAVAGYGDRIAGGEAAESELETRMRSDAEAQVTRGLRGHPLRRVAFAWVLEQTRRRVRCRENLRFERTRAFGAVRRIAVELGRRFAALNLLNDPHDVFYLTLDEVLAVVEGTAVTTRLNDVTAVRRAEYERYRALPALPARFQTRGVPYIGNQFLPSSAPCEEIGGARRHGIGCCPGLVRGTVRVIEDPRGASIAPGTIIVARRTDPGWVILFPAAAGLLVERGSMLSHSAIVAREMGLPAIVSIPGLVEWLADGDVVEMDGASGEIVRVEPKSPRNE